MKFSQFLSTFRNRSVLDQSSVKETRVEICFHDLIPNCSDRVKLKTCPLMAEMGASTRGEKSSGCDADWRPSLVFLALWPNFGEIAPS